MIPQAVYDLPDLAAKMGMTVYRAARYLERNGVPVKSNGQGSAQTVLLSDLRAAFPELYASFEEAAHLKKVAG